MKTHFNPTAAAWVITAVGVTLIGTAMMMPAGSQAVVRTIQVGPFVSSAATSMRSALRVFNTGSRGGNVTVRIRATDGTPATWTTTIAAHAAPQFDMSTIQAAASPSLSGANAAARFQFTISAEFPGQVQNLLWNERAAAWSNLSACASDTSTSGRYLGGIGVASAGGQSSTIAVQNSVARDQTASFEVYSVANGNRLGTYSVAVPANSAISVTASVVAAAVGFTPSTGNDRLNFIMNSSFTGFAQHLVDDQISGRPQA